jgi:hypothetical protein
VAKTIVRDTKKQFSDTLNVGDEQAIIDEPETIGLSDSVHTRRGAF